MAAWRLPRSEAWHSGILPRTMNYSISGRVYDPTNSPLPAWRVLSWHMILKAVCFGWVLPVGWHVMRQETGRLSKAEDLGLENDQINALALGSDHRLWVATMTGAAVQSGDGWHTYTLGNSGLPANLSFPWQSNQGTSGDVLWFGSAGWCFCIGYLDGEWQRYTARDLNLGWGGVADLLADSQGQVWVATLGGGISRWEGDHWTTLTTTNSELPYNSMSEIAEDMNGEIWLSASQAG